MNWDLRAFWLAMQVGVYLSSGNTVVTSASNNYSMCVVRSTFITSLPQVKNLSGLEIVTVAALLICIYICLLVQNLLLIAQS